MHRRNKDWGFFTDANAESRAVGPNGLSSEIVGSVSIVKIGDFVMFMEIDDFSSFLDLKKFPLYKTVFTCAHQKQF